MEIVREEGLNINISNLTILKYLIAFASIFQWYKLMDKTEILNIFNTSCPPCTEYPPCSCPQSNSEAQMEKLN